MCFLVSFIAASQSHSISISVCPELIFANLLRNGQKRRSGQFCILHGGLAHLSPCQESLGFARALASKGYEQGGLGRAGLLVDGQSRGHSPLPPFSPSDWRGRSVVRLKLRGVELTPEGRSNIVGNPGEHHLVCIQPALAPGALRLRRPMWQEARNRAPTCYLPLPQVKPPILSTSMNNPAYREGGGCISHFFLHFCAFFKFF